MLLNGANADDVVDNDNVLLLLLMLSFAFFVGLNDDECDGACLTLALIDNDGLCAGNNDLVLLSLDEVTLLSFLIVGDNELDSDDKVDDLKNFLALLFNTLLLILDDDVLVEVVDVVVIVFDCVKEDDDEDDDFDITLSLLLYLLILVDMLLLCNCFLSLYSLYISSILSSSVSALV